VRIGNVTYTVAPDRVKRSAEAQPLRTAPHTPPGGGSPPDQVDVRGLSVDEAMLEVESAIEAAVAGGGSVLRVIHGMGTGVLRRELTTWFRRQAHVAAFRRGGPGEGSEGVTVLTLKS
jgi:DNA mismatch repair protein MutS2